MTDSAAEQSVAAALQRVLLPGGLPDLAGWAVATLYEPAGEAVLVGGDFYDWVSLPDGRLLFFLGDVSGKGPLAGALGMSVRKALKGISWVTGEPLEAVPALERALADEFRDAFATVCLLELRPDSGVVRLLLAGHPPPWVRRQGRFEEVVAPANSLLGPGLRAVWESATLELEPGDSLFLFTDGLSDAQLASGARLGDDGLGSFLDSLPPSLSSYETVLQTDAHLRRVTTDLTDDVIIGVLTFQPAAAAQAAALPPSELRGIRLSPHSTSASVARQFAVDACRKWGLSADVAGLAELVASELVTNAVLHARTDLELRLAREDHALRIEVHDQSPILPALDAPGEAELAEFGRGLVMVARLGAELGAAPTEGGKQVWAVLPV